MYVALGFARRECRPVIAVQGQVELGPSWWFLHDLHIKKEGIHVGIVLVSL